MQPSGKIKTIQLNTVPFSLNEQLEYVYGVEPWSVNALINATEITVNFWNDEK